MPVYTKIIFTSVRKVLSITKVHMSVGTLECFGAHRFDDW